VKSISEAAKAEDKVLEGLIAVDTGMGRIGYLPDDPEAVEDIRKIAELSNFKITGMFSHMATADALDKSFSKLQEERYIGFYEKLKAAGIHVPARTFANSASIMEIPSVHYDAVRPGIILYGCYPSDEVDRNQLSIKPVMSVKANIVHLKKVEKGFSVGYGRKFIAERESLIATIALGYADGYPRNMREKGYVSIKGIKCPIIGVICMDQCMVDLSEVPDVSEGDTAIIYGNGEDNSMTIEEAAKLAGTNKNEIVARITARPPRKYSE